MNPNLLPPPFVPPQGLGVAPPPAAVPVAAAQAPIVVLPAFDPQAGNSLDHIVTEALAWAKEKISKSELLKHTNEIGLQPIQIRLGEFKKLVYEAVGMLQPSFPLILQNLCDNDVLAVINSETPYPLYLTQAGALGPFTAAQAQADRNWQRLNRFEQAQLRAFKGIRTAIGDAAFPNYKEQLLTDMAPDFNGNVYKAWGNIRLFQVMERLTDQIGEPISATLNINKRQLDDRQGPGISFSEHMSSFMSIINEQRFHGRVIPEYEQVDKFLNSLLPIYDPAIDLFTMTHDADATRTMRNVQLFLSAKAIRLESLQETRESNRPARGALRAAHSAEDNYEGEATDVIDAALAQAAAGHKKVDTTTISAAKLMSMIDIIPHLKDMGYTVSKHDQHAGAQAGRGRGRGAGRGGRGDGRGRGNPPARAFGNARKSIDLATYDYCWQHGFYAPGTGHTGEHCRTFKGTANQRTATAKNTMGGVQTVWNNEA